MGGQCSIVPQQEPEVRVIMMPQNDQNDFDGNLNQVKMYTGKRNMYHNNYNQNYPMYINNNGPKYPPYFDQRQQQIPPQASFQPYHQRQQPQQLGYQDPNADLYNQEQMYQYCPGVGYGQMPNDHNIRKKKNSAFKNNDKKSDIDYSSSVNSETVSSSDMSKSKILNKLLENLVQQQKEQQQQQSHSKKDKKFKDKQKGKYAAKKFFSKDLPADDTLYQSTVVSKDVATDALLVQSSASYLNPTYSTNDANKTKIPDDNAMNVSKPRSRRRLTKPRSKPSSKKYRPLDVSPKSNVPESIATEAKGEKPENKQIRKPIKFFRVVEIAQEGEMKKIKYYEGTEAPTSQIMSMSPFIGKLDAAQQTKFDQLQLQQKSKKPETDADKIKSKIRSHFLSDNPDKPCSKSTFYGAPDIEAKQKVKSQIPLADVASSKASEYTTALGPIQTMTITPSKECDETPIPDDPNYCGEFSPSLKKKDPATEQNKSKKSKEPNDTTASSKNKSNADAKIDSLAEGKSVKKKTDKTSDPSKSKKEKAKDYAANGGSVKDSNKSKKTKSVRRIGSKTNANKSSKKSQAITGQSESVKDDTSNSSKNETTKNKPATESNPNKSTKESNKSKKTKSVSRVGSKTNANKSIKKKSEAEPTQNDLSNDSSNASNYESIKTKPVSETDPNQSINDETSTSTKKDSTKDKSNPSKSIKKSKVESDPNKSLNDTMSKSVKKSQNDELISFKSSTKVSSKMDMSKSSKKNMEDNDISKQCVNEEWVIINVKSGTSNESKTIMNESKGSGQGKNPNDNVKSVKETVVVNGKDKSKTTDVKDDSNPMDEVSASKYETAKIEDDDNIKQKDGDKNASSVPNKPNMEQEKETIKTQVINK